MEPIEVSEEMRVPVISTAHYTQEDDMILLKLAQTDKYPVHYLGWGFLVFIGGPGEDQAAYWDQAGLSEAFINAAERLAESGYSWVRFGADALPVDGLETFDW